MSYQTYTKGSIVDKYQMANKITNESLRDKKNTAIIRDVIRDEIKAIDDAINKAHNDNHDSIEYRLPEIFAIPNIERSDAQLVVYAEICEEYDRRNLSPRLVCNNKGSFLTLRWSQSMSTRERTRLKKILSKYTGGEIAIKHPE